MKSIRNSIIPITLFCFVLETTIVGRSFTLLELRNKDAKLFAYMGKMISDGLKLYIDIWDIKPPGIFWVSTFTATFFSDHFLSLALIEAVVIIFSIFCVLLILKALLIDIYAIILAVISSAILFNLNHYNSGGNHTEIYLLLPTTLSIWLFIIAWQKNKTWIYVFAGMMTSIAVLFKLPGLSPYLAQLVFVVLMLWKQKVEWNKALQIICFLTLGLIIPWGGGNYLF